jgi:hypothetical protein
MKIGVTASAGSSRKGENKRSDNSPLHRNEYHLGRHFLGLPFVLTWYGPNEADLHYIVIFDRFEYRLLRFY